MEAQETRVLIVGYNGGNNAEAEALLLALIEDVRSVLGSSVGRKFRRLDIVRI
jgi:hypothetical protein